MIADILTELREKHGYTMKEVAEGIEVKPDTYRSYERGRLQPNLDVVVKLADFYNISADYLLGREPQSPNPILQLTQEEMERRLVAAYFSLPQKLRDEFLHSMAEELEKQGEIVETTTVGAELDRMAQSDAEAKDDAG